MREIDARNAAEYLQDAGLLAADEACQIVELAGGVSNLVLRVSFPDRHRPDFVLKQARPQLRTADPWFCTVERIWREVEVLRVCAELLSAPTSPADISPANIATPAVLFEDRQNFVFTMTAAPAAHTVWKADLMAGRADTGIARSCGRLLATLHGGAWGRADLAARLADRQIFRELRLDPYYRHVARVHPEDAACFQRLIDDNEARQLSLVHADFSPKNLLVFPGGLMLVDFETGHFGDPAFDLGFFLSHLILKTVYHAPRHEPFISLTQAFWAAYEAGLRPRIGDEPYQQLVARGIQNLAGCAWARIDGTSKIEYLTDPARQAAIRAFCRGFFHDPPANWNDVLSRLRDRCHSALES